MKTYSYLIAYLLIFININLVLCNIFQTVGNYLGFKTQDNEVETDLFELKVPYEVSTIDENFIKEAAKLTGLALSELDSCQHRVVLKLKTDCDKLNDEQLAKMAVHLLNCQSWVEGRPIFPCTDEMSIKDCTINMDSDTWTSYHLMSNRARAVCYTIRQSQFRGLAEHTINRLMDTARSQLKNLGEISSTQLDLKDLTEKTYLSVKQGQRELFEQQDDIKKAQFYGQLSIEDNIQRLANEKRLIAETHNNLIVMTRNIQQKLDASLDQLQEQSDESKVNHRELINDLLVIQEKTKDIFDRIEKSSSLLIKQSEDFNAQYKSTFRSLQEMNKTVSELIALIEGTWMSLEEKITWIITALGGTDLALDRIYLIFWHVSFVLMAMLICSFLAARPSTRLVVTLLPLINLILGLFSDFKHLELLHVLGMSGLIIITQSIILWGTSAKPKIAGAIKWNSESSKNCTHVTSEQKFQVPSSSKDDKEDECDDESRDTFQDFNITPPASRNGHYFGSRSRSRTPLSNSIKNNCHATTRMGTPCKLSSLPGRDFCYRHQNGSSVMG
ncbi:unnamed protein product [Phyllotreta striolata]|uniref:Protein brambleberry n=1 Tax=Phyllotreta striolata TaxID=444603 RepID=A0A9N9TT87_PHYSR|nr:unnamed protein product [Phyllotreta striolata]